MSYRQSYCSLDGLVAIFLLLLLVLPLLYLGDQEIGIGDLGTLLRLTVRTGLV
jgi:hypothetical protein